MANDFSFDIVSKVDMMEVDNALVQTQKEISQRFDFKGSISSVDREGESLKIVADDQTKLKNIKDVLEGKFVKRKISLKFLDYGKEEQALGGNIKQEIKIRNGLTPEKTKEINKAIKEAGAKVNTQIQGAQIRVAGKKKDDLQVVIGFLKQKDFGIELQFVNYR